MNSGAEDKGSTRATPAGDPFTAQCPCYDGFHFIGFVVELPDGEEETEYTRVPCKRCNQDDSRN